MFHARRRARPRIRLIGGEIRKTDDGPRRLPSRLNRRGQSPALRRAFFSRDNGANTVTATERIDYLIWEMFVAAWKPNLGRGKGGARILEQASEKFRISECELRINKTDESDGRGDERPAVSPRVRPTGVTDAKWPNPQSAIKNPQLLDAGARRHGNRLQPGASGFDSHRRL